MKTLDDLDFTNKKALVRVDFNVPLTDDLKVADDTRIKAALPTIKSLLEKGAAVILMSHLGRPKGAKDSKYSLKPVADYLKQVFKQSVYFAEDCIGEEVEHKAMGLTPGEVLLLENLRFHKEEKEGDENFAEKLSRHAEIYVNDAFGTAHRAHASTAVVAKFFGDRKCFGKLMEKELSNLHLLLEKQKSPFTAIIGGAKVSDKVGIIENLIPKVDNLIIGGAMAYTFIKASGGEVGKSLVEEEKLELASSLMKSARENGVQLWLPEDSLCAKEFKADSEAIESLSNNIDPNLMGLDIGSKAIKDFSTIIESSYTVLWNGPMGVFEFERFSKGTGEIAKAVARATEKGAFSAVGGGDSVAAVNKFNLNKNISFISTGGGALLEYLEGKELPGIAAIN